MNQPKTLGDLFGQAVAGLPKYLAEWTVSLVIVILTESLVTTIAVLAVLTAFALHSVLLGFVVFFAAYVVARTTFILGDAIAGSARHLASTANGLYAVSKQTYPLDHIEPPTQILIPEA